MKKMLLVLCVVMMGSLMASAASSTHYTVTLTNFCDSWDLTLDHGVGPFPAKVFVWGFHDVPAVCTGTFDTLGQKHGAAATTPPNNIYGTSGAVLDVQDAEGAGIPVEFLIRVAKGCGAAAYEGGGSFGGNFFIAEDTCSVGPAPVKTGLKPMIPRQ